MSKKLLQSVALASVLVGWGCSTTSSNGGSGGSNNSSGGSRSGGSQSGGTTTSGGNGSGGANSGGTTSASGGSQAGGSSGSATVGSGGSQSGGSSASGTNAGGNNAGGSNPGGSNTSGTATGGKGGSSAGGNSAGGNSAGGSNTAGGATGGRGGSSAGSTAGAGPATGGAAGGATGTGGGAAGSTGAVTVDLSDTHQTIEGFGLNTALGGGTVPWDSLYSTSGTGIGFSIVRVGLNFDSSSSGSLSGSKPASSYNAKVIGSVWTAPANCKDNSSLTKGGHLLTSCYDSFSTAIANLAKSQGLYAMSAANEPDFASCGSSIGPPCNGDYDTMVYTANEMVAWVKVLGPKLHALNPPVKLIAPEPSEWIHLWSNTSATGSTVSSHPNSSDPLGCGCFGNTPTTTGCASKCTTGGGYDYGHWLAKDATAWPLVDILGTHEYDSQKAEPWPSDVDGGKRSKEVWETEVSGVMYWPEQGYSSDINNGIAVAGWVHSALVAGEASAWLYWWYQPNGGSTGSDNEGLVPAGGGALAKRAYTIGNYSKFVRPGYVMVGVTGSVPTNVLLSAYTGTDGTVVVVAINKGSSAATVPISISGGTAAPASCTTYVTSSSANLAAGTTPITVTGGTFSASLAATTVTTFVCK